MRRPIVHSKERERARKRVQVLAEIGDQVTGWIWPQLPSVGITWSPTITVAPPENDTLPYYWPRDTAGRPM